MANDDGILTYAGLLFADNCPLLQSRVFCTRWNGNSKGSIYDDALDDKEFEGDLISLLKYASDFIYINSKVRWKKAATRRINKPDYAERAVFEALANAFMHRDHSIIGSEVHVDMYDNRLEIYSPGGMYDGSIIQNLDIEKISSKRRNPIIADMFHRLDYVERRGSGLKKIQNETKLLYGYSDEYAPKFISNRSDFIVVLMNLNYTPQVAPQVAPQVTPQDDILSEVLLFCESEKSATEIMNHCKFKDRNYFRQTILDPLLKQNLLLRTLPDKPRSRFQKYIANK